jgi:hypothetical protein
MTLLQDYIKQNDSSDFGVQAYVADVSARYPKLMASEWGHRKEVTCRWTIEYASGTDVTTSLLMLPLALLGHFFIRTSKMSFTTHHYLNPSEVRLLRRTRMIKHFLLPFAVLWLVLTGIALFMGLCCILVAIFPVDPLHPVALWPVLLCDFVLGLLVATGLKAQRCLWKMGEPPGSDSFRDQRIRLTVVEIT